MCLSNFNHHLLLLASARYSVIKNSNIESYHWCFKEYHGDISVTQSSHIQLHLLPITRKAIKMKKNNYILKIIKATLLLILSEQA